MFNMGMVFGDIFCCYPFLLDFVQRVGPEMGGDFTQWIWLRHLLSQWIRLRSRQLRAQLATSSTSQWIRLRSRQLRAQLALAIYTLLPVRIMTSTLVAVYFASCSIESRTSTYGFLLCGILLGVTLFI